MSVSLRTRKEREKCSRKAGVRGLKNTQRTREMLEEGRCRKSYNFMILMYFNIVLYERNAEHRSFLIFSATQLLSPVTVTRIAYS
jgi:hypothetical protein